MRALPTELLSFICARSPAVPMDRGPKGLRLTTAELGALGEELASRELRRQGNRLVGRNLRVPEGELDLVALSGNTLAVVEVKSGWWPAQASAGIQTDTQGEIPTRASPHRRPAARLTQVGLARRERAAKRLARSMGARHSRVDLIEVIGGRGPRMELRIHAGLTGEALDALRRRESPSSGPASTWV